MKIKEINKLGNWNDSLWTEALKSSVKENANNVIIGSQLVLEADKFNVWSTHLPKGESLPFHKHAKPYFYTAVKKGKSRSFYADGTIRETEYERNDIKYFNDLSEENFFIHNLENIGESALVFTIVEFK